MTDETRVISFQMTVGFIWGALLTVLGCAGTLIYGGFWFAINVTDPIATLANVQTQMQRTMELHHQEAVEGRNQVKAELDALYKFIYAQGRNGRNDRNHIPQQNDQ